MFGRTFEDMDGLALCTYVGTDLSSTDKTAYDQFKVFLLGASIGYLYRLEVGCTEGNELWIHDGRVFVIKNGTYYGIEIGL